MVTTNIRLTPKSSASPSAPVFAPLSTIMTSLIPLEQIRVDGGTQMRAKLNSRVVREYSQSMKDGAEFPPIVVFHDGSDHWVGDGFHRLQAAREAGLDSFQCEVRHGSKRDAILYACSANGKHGLQRSSADKRIVVETMLKDPEWVRWSNRVIAKKCGVSYELVRRLRNRLTSDVSQLAKRRGQDGRVCKPKTKSKTVAAFPRPDAIAEREATSEPSSVIERFTALWNEASPSDRSTIRLIVTSDRISAETITINAVQ